MKNFLPEGVLARLTEFRARQPEAILEILKNRRAGPRKTPDGRLNLLAADHPARGVTQVRSQDLAMGDRHDYLARILRVVAGNGVDGVMATMDILEDLLILDHLVTQAGGESFTDDKLLIPSLNRGGLLDSAWELDDPITGASPDACARWGMDGGKLLLRVDPEDRDSLKTLRYCAQAITRLAELGLPCFLEPLPVKKVEGKYRVVREAEAIARLVGVATALGESSRHIWLKLPFCPDYEIVAKSTTAPILLLGGPASDAPASILEEVAQGLAAGANVRGTLLGRKVLYPGDADPLAVARAVSSLVHEDATLDRATASIPSQEEAAWAHADAPWHRL